MPSSHSFPQRASLVGMPLEMASPCLSLTRRQSFTQSTRTTTLSLAGHGPSEPWAQTLPVYPDFANKVRSFWSRLIHPRYQEQPNTLVNTMYITTLIPKARTLTITRTNTSHLKNLIYKYCRHTSTNKIMFTSYNTDQLDTTWAK